LWYIHVYSIFCVSVIFTLDFVIYTVKDSRCVDTLDTKSLEWCWSLGFSLLLNLPNYPLDLFFYICYLHAFLYIRLCTIVRRPINLAADQSTDNYVRGCLLPQDLTYADGGHNWRSIIFSLLVIGFVIAGIVTAIYLLGWVRVACSF